MGTKSVHRLIVGFALWFFSIFLFSLFLVNCSGSIVYKAHVVLQKCEAELPRNQHCELSAVPVKK